MDFSTKTTNLGRIYKIRGGLQLVRKPRQGKGDNRYADELLRVSRVVLWLKADNGKWYE